MSPAAPRRRPPALPPSGGRIAVAAPASPPQERSGIEQATQYFETRGHEVVFGPNHRRVHGYLAGTDAERAADLQWALTEPGIDMVHALEGGYGTARCYPLIDWDAVARAEPRIVCGFSDLTALHLFIARHTDWVSFYGPSFLRFTRTKGDYALTEKTEEFFHRAVSGADPVGRIFEDPEEPYVLSLGSGVAEAPVVGGCLTLLCSSIGTPYEVETEGCILLVEDLDTENYLVDTALNHLRLAGKLDGIAGFAFGTSVNLGYQTLPGSTESTLSIEEILDELIAPARHPGDLQRAVRARQAHGDDPARRPGAARRRRQVPRADRARGGGRRPGGRRNDF